jgi:hypothetical protein
VLPEFDVEPEVAQVDPGLLRVVWLDEVLADGVGDNLMYEDISGTAWPEVEAVILQEDELIRAAAEAATDGDDFDRLVNYELEQRYPGDDFDVGPLSEFAGLDVGVMSAVAALSAAGCVTTTSCRGHRRHGEPSPLVRFATDEERLPVVQAAASNANCGLLLDEDGMLQLYAANVLALVEFARQMLQRRQAFDAIQTPVPSERLPGAVIDFLSDIRRRDL